MPNVKIFAEREVAGQVAPLMPRLCAVICDRLSVDRPAVQLALVEVTGLEGQPALNLEIALLPTEARTGAALRALAAELQAILAETGQRAAVRIATLDPATYVALK